MASKMYLGLHFTDYENNLNFTLDTLTHHHHYCDLHTTDIRIRDSQISKIFGGGYKVPTRASAPFG